MDRSGGTRPEAARGDAWAEACPRLPARGSVTRAAGFLVDWFIRTRRTPPLDVIVDLDPTDDPTPAGPSPIRTFHPHPRK